MRHSLLKILLCQRPKYDRKLSPTYTIVQFLASVFVVGGATVVAQSRGEICRVERSIIVFQVGTDVRHVMDAAGGAVALNANVSGTVARRNLRLKLARNRAGEPEMTKTRLKIRDH